MGRAGIDEAVVAEIVAAVADGFSYRQVGGRFAVSPTTVMRHVQASEMSKLISPEPVAKVREGVFMMSDRVKIAVAVERGESNTVIGERLGFSRSSVWREVKNNGGAGSYDAELAQQRACQMTRRPRRCWIESKPWLWDEVVALLRTKKWSPEQISNRLRKEHAADPDWSVSHESIYDAVFVQAKPELRKELTKCLRSGRANRVPHGRRSKHDQRPITGMVNISERPAEAEDRAVPGHWEGDLILGKNGRSYVATLVERSTRFGLLVKLDNKTAPHVAQRLAEHIKTLPAHLTKSLTWDCGTELADHQHISLDTNVDIYFCDPHSPWQRGSNENWNGLVRQFLPKGTDLSTHTQQDLDTIADLLNTRPRQTLDWNTPAEQFNQLVATTT